MNGPHDRVFAAARTGPVPVFLLTGFLGAGKTTLLNRLLASPEWLVQRPALVINEFGDLGVDGKRVPSEELEKFEINSGSVFCACTQAQVIAALGQIAARRQAGCVLVEATGVAETGDLESYFETAALSGQFAIRANLCLVDAAQFTKVLAYVKAAENQVLSADGLVINKSDLVTPRQLARLQELLSELNPHARQCTVMHGAVPGDFVLSLVHRRLRRTASPVTPQIAVVTIRSQTPLDRRRFQKAIQQLDGRLLRLKGNVDFGAGPVFVEFAGDQLTEQPACPGLGTPVAFSVIGWKITREELLQAFAEEDRCSPTS